MSDPDLVLAADFGTSSVKVALVDRAFTLIASHAQPYPVHLSEGGVAEQNPQDWWDALAQAIDGLRADAPDLRERTACMVFASQIASLVCADAQGTPLRPCITWMDKRAAPQAKRMVGGFPSIEGYYLPKFLQWLRLANGAPAQNGMEQAAKVHWLRENEPHIIDQSRWFLDTKDWLLMQATGVVSTSAESANLTWCLDSRPGREAWSPRLAKLTGLPLDRLPQIRDGSDVLGPLLPAAAQHLGLREDTQVLAGISDVTAAALGAGAVEDGELHISSATSHWLSGFFDGRRLNALKSYATITSALDYRPILIATQESAGSAVDWAARMFGGGDIAQAFDALGPVQARDPFFFPWLAGERVPYDNADLRGAFHGLALHHDPQAIRRAVLEGLVQNHIWAYQSVRKQKGVKLDGPIALVGGMAANGDYAQMLANGFDRAIRVGPSRFAGVLGAATVAAPLMGWDASVWDAARRLKDRPTQIYEPQPEQVAVMQARTKRLSRIRKHILRSYS